MTGNPFLRLKQIFNTLIELPENEREGYLDAQSGIDDEMRRQLEDLLRADGRHANATTRRAMDAKATSPSGWIGQKIGGFRIERVLGHGGMGNVFLAQRVDGGAVQQAAIKTLHAWRLDSAGLARFRLEGQVLALLQHPNIAMLHDLGELSDGAPYVIMEYVRGTPLLEFQREHNLDVQNTLQLFLLICEAVSYAHRNLVVHRDIKPSNILVDQNGMPKLLDFGIAKPLVDRLGNIDIEKTGTAQQYFSLRNVAPEQLLGQKITVACDVYGLGTLLYEMVSGHPAHDLDGLAPAQAQRRVIEEEPLPPSRRAAAPEAKQLRGDLDAITAKALRKNPQQRYRSVDEFAADVRRHLRGYPVDAREGTGFYRATRFFHRHRTAIVTTSMFVALVLAAATLLSRQYLSTQSERVRAESVTGVILDALESVDPSNAQGKELTAREVFDQVGKRALASLYDQPATRTRILATLARINLQLGLPKEAVSLLDTANSESGSTHDDVLADMEATRAEALMLISRFDLARAALDAATAHAQNAAQRAELQLLDAKLLKYESKPDEAIAVLQNLIAPASNASEKIRFSARRELADAFLQKENRPEAWATGASLLADQRKVHTIAHPELLKTINYLADIALYAERNADGIALTAEALAMTRQLYGPDTHPYSTALNQYATAISTEQRFDEAQKHLAESLRISRQLLGDDAFGVGGLHFNLANLYARMGEDIVAQTHYREALRIGEMQLKDASGALYLFRALLAHNLVRTKNYAEAIEMVDRALGMAVRHPEIDDPDLDVLSGFVRACAVQGHEPSDEHRVALRDAMARARAGAVDAPTKQFVALLTPSAELLLR